MKRRHHLPKDRSPEPRAALRPRRHRAVIAAMMAGLASVMLLAIWLVPVPPSPQPAAHADRTQTSEPSGWTVGMLRPDGLRIIVTGREDASAVLDPQRVSQAEVRHGYWIANCPVCLGTAEIAYDMTVKGTTDAAKIRAAVDVHWGPTRRNR